MANSRPTDPFNAFTDHEVVVEGAVNGALAGTTFAVKDLYDVAGQLTRAGSPDWARTHEPAASTAPAIQMLLDAGATLVAKTHTDELAWSLLGENAHYGTPTNPRAPERVPGGSSSGSVVAVTGELVDFAVGSDTGGSVRIPASNCGIYGIRTTHGRIPLDHVVPLAPSYDTVGWFAREPELFARVGEAYFGSGGCAAAPRTLIVARDAFDLVGDDVRAALEPSVDRACRLADATSEDVIFADGLGAWFEAWRILQSREVWAKHGEWVRRVEPSFGPGIFERFEAAASLTQDDEEAAQRVRELARERMQSVCRAGTVLCLPAAPAVAPVRGTAPAELEDYRARAMQLTCPAGHAGLPQLSVPAGEIDGAPIGLSFVGAAGSDGELLELAIAYGAG